MVDRRIGYSDSSLLFLRATISFPSMQPCQRRTIGGTEGGGGGGRVILSPPNRPSSTTSVSPRLSPSHPIPSVRRDCTARGRYWGAYGSAQGDAPVRLSTPSLSIYLFQSTLARDYMHVHIHPSIYLSLSLSGAMIIRLCPPCRHIRRVYDSVPLVPVDACPPPALYNTVPTVYYSVRPFLRRVSGRRGKRFMGGG